MIWYNFQLLLLFIYVTVDCNLLATLSVHKIRLWELSMRYHKYHPHVYECTLTRMGKSPRSII